MDLADIRSQLDTIDREVVRLYQKRMALCKAVAESKIQSGKAVFDPQREEQKLTSVRNMVSDNFDKIAIEDLYRQLMTISRRLQYGILQEHGKSPETGFQSVKSVDVHCKNVVYQGVEGAYAHIAALKSFPDDCRFSHVRTFKDAMDAVIDGSADYAVLPIENSSQGSVSDNLDLLVRYPQLVILGSCELKIQHALMGIRGAKLSGIRKVYSHPQALGQCSAFLERHPEIEAVPVLNTAVAARRTAEENDPSAAALASEISAELYGLHILKTAVNENSSNTTRFIIVGRQKVYLESAGRISLCFVTAHKPGSLYNVLGSFIFNDVNMLKIESRPIPEKPFSYRFFADIEGRLDMANIQNALRGIEDQTTELRILGCY